MGNWISDSMDGTPQLLINWVEVYKRNAKNKKPLLHCNLCDNTGINKSQELCVHLVAF